MSEGSSYSGGGGGSSNNLYPAAVQQMSLHPPDYDPRRLFPFGLSPIPEVPSELASEVSSIASSPTPSFEDSDTEAESCASQSRASIMYSGSCDSIKSNVTLHGKEEEEEEEEEEGSSEDTDTEEEETEEETEEEEAAEEIPEDNTPIMKVSEKQSTLYNSEVTQVLHQRTFLEAEHRAVEEPEERKTLAQWTQECRRRPKEEEQATRGKQEVTTELAKILTVLKTTLQTGTIDKDDSSSSDEESGLHQVKKNKECEVVTCKPPRPPLKSRPGSAISPAIQAKIKELETSKVNNPKEEMNLLSKILVHLLCSCKTVAAAQELKGIIKQFKEVAKVAMEEGDDTLELLRSNSRASSRTGGCVAAVRRKVRSRTASGNSNVSANSETDSMNTLTPGDSKSSGTDDEVGQDPNIGKMRFTSEMTRGGGGRGGAVESSVSYTLTLPLTKADIVQAQQAAPAAADTAEAGEGEDDEWEWEYEDDSAAVTPTKQCSSGSSRNLTPSEAKSEVSSGSTKKLLTEMEMGAYNCSSGSHSEHHSTTITEEEEEVGEEEEASKKQKTEVSGPIFCHLEETFKVLSDTYKIITTGNSPDSEEALCPRSPDTGAVVDESFEDILDGISSQCVQLETEITRSSRESSVQMTSSRQCTASPAAAPVSPAPPPSLPPARPLSRPTSRTGSRVTSSRPGSRLKTKTPVAPGASDEDWGDEDEWEYYYEDDDWDDEQEEEVVQEVGAKEVMETIKSRPPSQQTVVSRPLSRQSAKHASRPSSRQSEQIVSHQAAQTARVQTPASSAHSGEQAEAVRPASKAASIRTASRTSKKEEECEWEWDESGEWDEEGEWEYEYYYEEEVDASGQVTSRPVSRARVASRQGAASRQGNTSRVPSRVVSRAASRAEEILDHAKSLEKHRAPSRQANSRPVSRQDLQSRPASKQEHQMRAVSRQDIQVRAASRTASGAAERPASRQNSRPSSRVASAAAGDDEDEWEYYYEEDYPDAEEQQLEEDVQEPANHNENKQSFSATGDSQTIVINPCKDLPPRPGSRGSLPGSRPGSRSGSRPVSRNASRLGKKNTLSSLGNVEEEGGEDYDDEEYGFDEDDMKELRGSSPTLTTAPTTRATSPSMVFPDNKDCPHLPNTGFSKRRISVIDEVEETSTPRPLTGHASRTSAMPHSGEAKTPSLYQSPGGEVGYLNPMAGVSVALAAEYLGQDAQKVVANLPADFIEENQVIVKERRKKKHRSKGKDHCDEEEDDEERRRRKKKGRKKDGKFLPKVGVKELAARMEGELFQDMQVGTKMVITRDEARDVIRESRKKALSAENSEARGQTVAAARNSPITRSKDEEKRKSVREMVQLLSNQLPMTEESTETGGYSCAVTSCQQQQFNIPSISVSSQLPPPVPPLPKGYYTSPTPQYPQQYQPYPVEVRPQYPPQYMAGHESPYQQYPPPPQQYQQYPPQQQYHAYQGYPPPPPQHYQYPPQQHPQQYPPQMTAYPPGYQSYPPPPPQLPLTNYPPDTHNQVKVVSSSGQTTIVTMRAKAGGAKASVASRTTKSPEVHEVARSPVDSEAYGTGSTGSDGTEGQVAGIEHDEGGAGAVVDSQGNPVKKRHSRLFKLLQDSDYTDSDTESRSDYSRISMKNVEEHHNKESDIDSVCSGLERSRDHKSIDRKHSFRSHKSSNKESDNESVTSSGFERKISPNSIQKNLTTRRFMQLSLKNDYEPSSSELSTPNSPTAVGPEERNSGGRRRSQSKPPTRVWNYHADDFDTHAGVSDDSSYQSLQSLNSFESVYDTCAGQEVEEILKMKVHRDNLYHYQTDSPVSYVTASPKAVDMLRNSPKTQSTSPRQMSADSAGSAANTASPKFEQELLELANFPSSPSISLRQLHSHRSFYGGHKQ